MIPRLYRRVATWRLTWLMLSLAAVTANGAEPRPLVVGTFADPPFVQNQNGKLNGFSVELWEAIATQLNQPFTWRTYTTSSALLAAAKTGAVDVAMTDLSITSDRCSVVDFSQPYFESGLRVMLTERRQTGILRLWHTLRDAGHVLFYAQALLVIIIISLIVMLLERRFNREFPQTHPEAFAESLYHVVSVLLQGKTTHAPVPGIWGRLLAVFWMACGVTVVSYVTATVSSEMTAITLRGKIYGPADLTNQVVATLPGTMSEQFLQKMHIASQAYPDLDTAVTALCQHRIDAIVYDAPVLENYDQRHPELPITVMGPVFGRHNYGIVFPPGSPLRNAVDTELLRMQENGAYDLLRTTWFGNTRE